MTNNIKITLPENPITPEEVKKRIRAMFKNDFDKDGILAKSFVFTKLTEPTYAKEIKLKLQEYYSIEFDKTNVSKSLKRLSDLGLLNSTTSGDLMTLKYEELNPLQQIAHKKFFYFLDTIPTQFRKKYDALTFYWISTKGEEYIKWCCDILGFDCD